MRSGKDASRVRPLQWMLLLLALAGGSVLPVAPAHAVSDPLEPINRPLFVLNDKLDRYALRPIARGYDAITPAPVQRGIGNFFANLYDVTSALNAVLQWRWDGAAQSGGRVLVTLITGHQL